MKYIFFLIILIITGACMDQEQKLNEGLHEYTRDIQAEFDNIPGERKEQLKELADYVADNDSVNLTFICTHNSRRSHMAQLWAQAAAHHYGINAECYSGGTEATAFNPRAVKAMKKAGFIINEKKSGDNPVYEVIYSSKAPAVDAFSKKYEHEANPSENFAAVMVCSHADENCPFVPGAKDRFSIPYDDPKDFDGTEQEEAKYDERCRDIAREMYFVMKEARGQ